MIYLLALADLEVNRQSRMLYEGERVSFWRAISMDADLLRGIAAACSVGGSLLLAWRVTGILRALGSVASIHESNIMELSKSHGDIVIGHGSTKWIKKAQKIWLLVIGFLLSIVGGVLQFVASFWGT